MWADSRHSVDTQWALPYLTVKNPVCHAFHAQNADVLFDQFWHNQLREAPVVGIHHIQRQLNRIKLEPCSAATSICR